MSDEFDPDAYLAKVAQPKADDFDPDAYLKARAPAPDKSLFKSAMDTLDYPGRVTRTAIGAAISPDIDFGDVVEQARTLNDVEGLKKQAPSFMKLMDESNEHLKLPSIGVNPDFKGPVKKEVGFTEGFLGPKPEKVLELDDGNGNLKKSKSAGIYEPAAMTGEMLSDVSNYIPIGKAGKAVGRGAGEIADLLGKYSRLAGGKGAQIAGDLAEGAVKGIGKTLNAVPGDNIASSYTRSVGSAISDVVERSKPKISSKLEKLQTVAKNIGLADDEISDAVRFGTDSDIARNTRVLAEAPGSAPLRDAHNATSSKITSGLKNEIQGLSKGRMAHVSDNIEAGKRLSDDFAKAQNELKGAIDWDRGMAYKQTPGITMTEEAHQAALKSLDNASRKALGLAETALDPTIASQAQKASNILADAFKNTSSAGDLETIHGQLQKLGDIAFGPSASRAAPEVKSVLRDAYFDMAKQYDDSVKKILGPAIGSRIEEGNKLWKEWYQSADDFAKTVASGDDAEKVYKRLVQSGGSGELTKYRDFMVKHNPEGIENFKTVLMQDLFESAKTREGFNHAKFIEMLSDPEVKGKLKIFYSPEEISKLSDIAELGKEHGPIVFNTSRTETARGLKGFVENVNQRAQLEAAQESLKKRAQYPNGLPLERVRTGERMIEMPKALPQPENVIPMRKAGEVKVDALKAPIQGASDHEAKIKALLQSYRQFAKPKEENNDSPTQNYVPEKQAQDEFLKGNGG